MSPTSNHCGSQRLIRLNEKLAIGQGCPTFLAAEIGGNHGGDQALARKMIEAAAEAGADGVKFQAYRTDKFLSGLSPYYQELRAEELPFKALGELAATAHDLGLAVGLTVFDQAGLELADRCRADFIKISSGDLTYHRLLNQAALVGRPLFVSTGAATEAEVLAALEALAPARERLVLMQCAAIYPAPPESANLAVMSGWMSQGMLAGYSDHTIGLDAPMMAIALGAAVLEKHFSTDRHLPGGDNSISALPDDFKSLARWKSVCQTLHGQTDKKPHPLEETIRPLFRRAVVASRDLAAGRRLTESDLALKRPASAAHILGPECFDRLIGATLKAEIKEGEALTKIHLADRPDG